MKHPKSLKVVCAALAVSMVPLFGSCDSGADSAAEELEQIKSAFNIHSIDWQLPDELPEKFTLRADWVWETVWLEEDKLTLENIHSEQLGGGFDAEEVVKTGKCRADNRWGLDNTKNSLSDTPLRMFVQVPGTSNDGSLRCSIVVGDKHNRTTFYSKLRLPYPDGNLIGWGVSSGTLGLQFKFDENDVHCHLEFEVVDGW